MVTVVEKGQIWLLLIFFKALHTYFIYIAMKSSWTEILLIPVYYIIDRVIGEYLLASFIQNNH